MLYNRARIIITDLSIAPRDTAACRQKYDNIFADLFGHYAGYMSHCGAGPRPAHFYMIDDPGDDILVKLLFAQKDGMAIRIEREFIGQETIEYNIDAIVREVARIIGDEMLNGEKPSSSDLARCWSGVCVLEKMARG